MEKLVTLSPSLTRKLENEPSKLELADENMEGANGFF